MRTMPSNVIAANGCDMLCHCIEAFTANNAQPFTDALALYAIPLIANNIVSLYRGEGTDEQWSKVCLSGTIGGMVINTAGITLGHAMEHPVSGLKDITHGRGLAAIEPAAIEATYRYNRFKFGASPECWADSPQRIAHRVCGPCSRASTLMWHWAILESERRIFHGWRGTRERFPQAIWSTLRALNPQPPRNPWRTCTLR